MSIDSKNCNVAEVSFAQKGQLGRHVYYVVLPRENDVHGLLLASDNLHPSITACRDPVST